MALVFRTTGSGTWGTGKGSGLTSVEIDNNFYELNRDKFAKSGGTITGATSITNTTASSSSTTGALVVSGGVGVGGRLSVGTQATIGISLSIGESQAGDLLSLGSGASSITLNNSGTPSIRSGAGLALTLCSNGSLTVGLTVNTNGSVTVSGDVTAFGSASDITLKENITPLTSALEKVTSLNGYYFNYKGDTRKLIGVIAQEVEPIFPEIVYEFTQNGSDENKKAVKYELLTAALIEAIKELNAKVEDLQKQLSNK